jgi:hypothetical protein
MKKFISIKGIELNKGDLFFACNKNTSIGSVFRVDRIEKNKDHIIFIVVTDMIYNEESIDRDLDRLEKLSSMIVYKLI